MAPKKKKKQESSDEEEEALPPAKFVLSTEPGWDEKGLRTRHPKTVLGPDDDVAMFEFVPLPAEARNFVRNKQVRSS